MELESMDAFRLHKLTTDDTLQQQPLAEGTKLVHFCLKPTGFTTTFSSHGSRLSLCQEHPNQCDLPRAPSSGWIITAVVVHIIYKHIWKLQARLLVPPRIAHQFRTIPLPASNPCLNKEDSDYKFCSWKRRISFTFHSFSIKASFAVSSACRQTHRLSNITALSLSEPEETLPDIPDGLKHVLISPWGDLK